MIGKKSILILSFVLFWCSSAQAMTVSDPGSYGYYVQQLQQAMKQIEEQKKQFGVLTESYEMLQDQFKELQTITDQVKGYYNQGKDFVGQIKSIQSQLESIPSNVIGAGKDIVNLIGAIGDFTESGDMLDGIFGDPRSPNYNPWKVLAPKYELRQKALKSTISESEKLLAGMKERFSKLSDLVGKIDQTENIKEAQDLTNVYLAQIYSILAEQLALTAQIGQAQSLLDFSGVKDAELAAHEERRKEKVSKYNKACDEYMSKAGSTDSSLESFTDIINQ